MIGTENQFIINYTTSQSAGEAHDFVRHMEKFKDRTDKKPKAAIGDAAYGSEENYDYLEKEGLDNYLKYSGIYYEKSQKHKRNPFHKDNFQYDPKEDVFTCPNNQKLYFKEEGTRRNANGYISKTKKYQCDSCDQCPFFNKCTTGKNRALQFSPRYNAFKDQVKKNYGSVQGEYMKKQRGVDVETPFGDIKHNQGYRRFR